MNPRVSPTPDWNARAVSASGMRVLTPMKSEAAASAMNAGIRSQVTSATTTATAASATIRTNVV
jgi:hypothetical protein